MRSNKRKHPRLPSPDMDKDEQLALIADVATDVLNRPEFQTFFTDILGTPVHFTFDTGSIKPASASRPRTKQNNPRSTSTRKSRKETEQ